MMYLLFRLHSIKPGEYYYMSAGEKAVTRAFMKRELEDRKKEADKIRNS